MKHFLLPKLYANAAVLLALIAAWPASTLAAPTPMRLAESFARTDVINVGANTIGALSTGSPAGGQGTLEVAGLSGTVNKAWLYWKGIENLNPQNGFVGGNGTYDEPEIRFDGQLITGTLVAANGSVDCHPTSDNFPPSGALYRADVTSFVQARGNGSYAFSGLSNGLESVANDSDAHSANGLSLLIYYDDGNSANDRRIDQYEGQLSNTEGTWEFEFPLDYIGGTVELILHVSDGQSLFPNDGETIFTTRPGRSPSTPAIHRFPGRVFADGLPKYAGLSVPSMNRAGGRESGLWDIRRVPITMQFTRPARHVTRLTQRLENDCVSLQIAQVVSASSAESAMLSPAVHDFGDVVRLTQSPTQTFTFTNLLPHPIAIPSAPFLSDNDQGFPSSWHLLLAQNCSGQTLAAGSTCSFDVACRPEAGSGAESRPSANVTLRWNQVLPAPPNYTGVVFSTLRCAGVPAGPFTRLQFALHECFLTDTPVNGTAVTPPLIVRNTSLFPATITLVGVNNINVQSFSVLSTTCETGLVLAPNDSCSIRVLYRAQPAGSLNRGSLVAGFSSTTDPNVRFTSLQLQARTELAVNDGETLFKNGFDFGEAECLD